MGGPQGPGARRRGGRHQGFSVHLTGKGHMITIGAPQFKWKLDKDHAFFNAAVEPMLTANAHRKRVALSSKDEEPSSAGVAFERPKNFGNGRVRVLGAFHCEFLGDIVPPENPY